MINYKHLIADVLAEVSELETSELSTLLEIPPQSELGDFALPCFIFAKVLRKAPAQIANEFKEKLEAKSLAWLDRIEVKGPYLNFFLDKSAVIAEVVTEVLNQKNGYGKDTVGEGKTILVEYSSPNIAKPFHIGHAFTTILGQVIGNLYESQGYKVVRLNHLGDYGTQFGKLISAWKRWGDEEALKEHPIEELTRVYVKFHQEVEKNPELETEAREYFRKLEAGESEEVALWTKFRNVSLEEFERIYRRMGIHFDNYNGESFYSDKIPAVVDLLREKGLLENSEGAQIVRLEEYKLNPCLILKSDGTTIYASRDLASIYYRDKTWNFDKNIYVVGLPQKNHFQQVFAVMEKAGFPKAKDCLLVPFGTVKFADGQFSTRSGNIIKLEELINQSVAKTREIIETNNPEMSTEEVQEIAEAVGLAAVEYTYLHNGRERDIFFDWDEVLDFEGDSAPYLLYTLVRCRSILRKAELAEDVDLTCLGALQSDDEFTLAKLLGQYPEQIKQALKVHEPSILLRHIALIARNFNRFYHHNPILNCDDENTKLARVLLTKAVEQVMSNGLKLCSIPTVDRM